MSDSAKKEFREIIAIIRKKDFKVIPGKGHYKIIDVKGKLGPKGTKVRDEHGPVVISSSPGDFRARDLLAARLMRAGILEPKDLPWKPMKKQEADGILLGEPEPEKPERLTEAQAERRRRDNDNRTRHEKTQAIKGELEPIITRLGGWTKRGMIGELASVVYHHSKDSPWGFKSVSTARASATNLRGGGTLSDDHATCWEGLLMTLAAADMDGRLQEAWFDLVRAARGLPPRTQPVSVYRPGTAVGGEEPQPVFPNQKGDLVAEMEKQYGGRRERPSWPAGEEHPVLALHEDGGVRWPVDFTVDDLHDFDAAVGMLEVLALQLAALNGNGNGLAAPAVERMEKTLARLRELNEKIGEARFRNLAGRGQVATKGAA